MFEMANYNVETKHKLENVASASFESHFIFEFRI